MDDTGGDSGKESGLSLPSSELVSQASSLAISIALLRDWPAEAGSEFKLEVLQTFDCNPR